MNRLLGILSVILFWIVVLTLSPVVIFVGVAIFVLSIMFAISSMVYEFTTHYLERKKR